MVALGIGVSAMAAAEKLDGRWAATTTQGELTIPFRLGASRRAAMPDKHISKIHSGGIR